MNYDETKADAIYSQLASKEKSNNYWRIRGTYSDTTAEKEATDIQKQLEDDLIQSSPAVSAPGAAPAVRVSFTHIRAPNPFTRSDAEQPKNLTPPKGVLPKGAAGSSQPDPRSLRSAPRKPTNATAAYRSALHN